MTESWLPIPGYEGMYEVSDQGRVMSVRRQSVMRPQPKRGYLVAKLSRDGVQRGYRVGQLVLMAFVGPRPDGMETRHLDGDALNNRLSNILWDTHLNNMHDKRQHADPTALHPSTHCAGGHEWTPETEYKFVRPDGRNERHCRRCRRERLRSAISKPSKTRYNPDAI